MNNRNNQPDGEQGYDRNYDPAEQQRYSAGMSARERRYYGPNRTWPGNPRPDQYYGQGYGVGYQGDYYEQVYQGESPPGEYGRGRYDQERVSGNYGNFNGNLIGATPQGPHTGKGPRNYQRPDDRIHDEINQRLTQHGHIDASDIDVSVKDGYVMLSGTVDDRRSKRLAEDIADDVYGVRDVQNNLHVKQSFLNQLTDKITQHGRQESQQGQSQHQVTGANSH